MGRDFAGDTVYKWQTGPWPFMGRWKNPLNLAPWREREHQRVYNFIEEQRVYWEAQEIRDEAAKVARKER